MFKEHNYAGTSVPHTLAEKLSYSYELVKNMLFFIPQPKTSLPNKDLGKPPEGMRPSKQTRFRARGPEECCESTRFGILARGHRVQALGFTLCRVACLGLIRSLVRHSAASHTNNCGYYCFDGSSMLCPCGTHGITKKLSTPFLELRGPVPLAQQGVIQFNYVIRLQVYK